MSASFNVTGTLVKVVDIDLATGEAYRRPDTTRGLRLVATVTGDTYADLARQLREMAGRVADGPDPLVDDVEYGEPDIIVEGGR